jgi:hypothetical protein
MHVLSPDGSLRAALPGLSRGVAEDVSPALLAELCSLAAETHDAVALSPLHRDAAGMPVFHLIRQLQVGVTLTDCLRRRGMASAWLSQLRRNAGLPHWARAFSGKKNRDCL